MNGGSALKATEPVGGFRVTVAVCLECGQRQAGAWTPRPACRYQPRAVEELAKSG
jgi:hypothetical protein